MWKQFSREKPARRGWTLVTMAAAFLGTAALAHLQIQSKAFSITGGKRVERGRWPLTFVLPNAYKWELRDTARTELYYIASSGRVQLHVKYYELDESDTLSLLVDQVAELHPNQQEELEVGLMDEGLLQQEGRTYEAIGKQSTLAVKFLFIGSGHEERDRQVIQYIAGSVEVTNLPTP